MSDEDTKPLFLRAQDPETWEKPDDATWGDHFLAPHRPLSARHKRLAELLFLGKKNNEIATELGYTQARVSVLKSNSKILAEVERLREKSFEKTIDERLKDLGPMALDAMEEIFADPSIPSIKKESLAKWIVEMRSGKATQKVDVSGEISIGHFMDKLDSLPTKDVTPNAPTKALEASVKSEIEVEVAEQDFAAQWLDENL